MDNKMVSPYKALLNPSIIDELGKWCLTKEGGVTGQTEQNT